MVFTVVACGKGVQIIVVTATPQLQAPTLPQPTATQQAGNVLGGGTTSPGGTIATALPTVLPPTAAPTAEQAPAYYTEEFNGSIDNWKYFMAEGDEDHIDISTDNGFLVFTIKGQRTWPYVTYTPWIYTDVRIDAVAENRGSNDNDVTLICRYDPDKGWYEFNISNGGLYFISVVHFDKGKPAWDEIVDGGSGVVKPGIATNTYTATCKGDKLSFYVNGTEIKTITVPGNVPHISEGRIGVSVSSYNDPNVTVAFDSVTISQP